MASTVTNFCDATTVGELTELVKGYEQELVERFAPLVRRQDLALDLTSVERIDAAGIAALLSLYHCAHETGHRFSIANPSARVTKILALVGLDQILLSHMVTTKSHCGSRGERPAA